MSLGRELSQRSFADAVEVFGGADEELASAGGDGGSEDFFVVGLQVAAADDFQSVGGFDDYGFSAIFDEGDQAVVGDRAGGDRAADAFGPELLAGRRVVAGQDSALHAHGQEVVADDNWRRQVAAFARLVPDDVAGGDVALAAWFDGEE